MFFLKVIKQYPSVYFLFLIVLLQSCTTHRLSVGYNARTIPTKPDYANLNCWAAHPDKKDLADSIPRNSGLKNEQSESQIDVFFLHPTTLLFEKRYTGTWNGDVQDAYLNKKTDESSILYQASLFNGVGRVFAPRYRQAHIDCFFTKDTASSHQAFAVAYEDIKTAFEYYLKHLNQGRPIIIASHSQGTMHAAKLLKEYFDNKPLQNKLVVAYIVGLPIMKDQFHTIRVCETPEQTGCFCSWRTFKKDYEPKKYYPLSDKIAVVNPLSWTTEDGLADASKHEGAVLVGFKPTKDKILDAQIHKGILWITKPKFKGSILYTSKNYHPGDFNLFYFNIRNDVKRRVGLYWKT